MKARGSFLLLFMAMSSWSRAYGRKDDVVGVPAISSLDLARALPDIYLTRPSITLIPHSPDARSGRIWLRATDDGLHVWGKINADEKGFHWPQQKSEMLSGDHIEIWLAASRDVSIPGIGWGNQFGPAELASLKDCANQVDPHTGDAGSGAKDCERWYTGQLQYRHHLRRLFVRQWLIAGSDSSGPARRFEGFATTAYVGLGANFFSNDLPNLLKPASDDGLVAEIGSDVRPENKRTAGGAPYTDYHQAGYHFHVFIPYRAFPPTPQLQLADVYLTVDDFSSAPEGRKMGDYLSTASKRQWGPPATFNHLRLATPRTFSVSPCEYKLEQQDLYGQKHPSWFFPAPPVKGSDLRSTFALINPAGGYMYAPSGVSPEVTSADYFWKQLANGATVCNPRLAWRDGATIKQTDFNLDGERFEAQTLPDGWTLVLSGPTASRLSVFGFGQCGACSVMDFNVFAILPQGEITTALALHGNLGDTLGQPAGADLTIAPEWKRVILYEEMMVPQQTEDTRPWASTTYCLEGHGYKQCAESKQAQPPDPPHFKEFRPPPTSNPSRHTASRLFRRRQFATC